MAALLNSKAEHKARKYMWQKSIDFNKSENLSKYPLAQ
jgi:hypothetical protein